MTSSQLDRVNTLLAAAGLDPSAAERQKIAENYEAVRPAIDGLYTMPEARYEVPAMSFDARPPLTEW